MLKRKGVGRGGEAVSRTWAGIGDSVVQFDLLLLSINTVASLMQALTINSTVKLSCI